MELTEYFLGWARAHLWEHVRHMLQEAARTERPTFVSLAALSSRLDLMDRLLGVPS